MINPARRLSAGLVQLYFQTRGVRRPGSINPRITASAWPGMWLLGTGLTVVVDGEPEQKR